MPIVVTTCPSYNLKNLTQQEHLNRNLTSLGLEGIVKHSTGRCTLPEEHWSAAWITRNIQLRNLELVSEAHE